VVFKVDENGAESSILPMLPMLALLRRSQHVSKCLFDCCKNPNLLQVIVFGCLSSDHHWISAWWWQVDFGFHLLPHANAVTKARLMWEPIASCYISIHFSLILYSGRPRHCVRVCLQRRIRTTSSKSNNSDQFTFQNMSMKSAIAPRLLNPPE
jgi:hypothetical protein